MSEMKCKRCGTDENRIDGFCSIECRDAFDYEEEIAELQDANTELRARIAELEALVDELKPYRDGYDPEEVFPPEGEWVWLRDCDDNIEPVQYSHKTEWYWNYEGYWMPDNGDIRRWYPIGKLPEVQE